MTAQKHIDAIGKAQVRCEEATKGVLKAARALNRALDDLHAEHDKAQAAYMKENPTNNIVAFSGGTNKPPQPPVDEPLPPIPGP